MPVREDAFTTLLIKPLLFVMAVYVVAALAGAILGDGGFFFATFVTVMVCLVVLPFYFWRDLSHRRRRPRFAPSRPL